MRTVRRYISKQVFTAVLFITAGFLALFAFFGGLLYGFVISVISVKLMGINSFWAYYIAGIPFDLLHGLGNAGFYLILEPILVPLLAAYKKRY